MQSPRLHIAAIILVTLWLGVLPCRVEAASGVSRKMASPVSLVASGAGSVEVSSAGDQTLRAEPGETVTAIFVVRNTADEPRTFSADITLPTGWQLVSAPASFVIPADTAVRRLVSFRVNSESPAKTFQVGFRVWDQVDRESEDEASVSIRIGETHRLDIEVLSAPDWVPSGLEYKVALLVANAGNASVSLALVATVIPESDYSLSLAPSVVLAPRETRELVATIVSPSDLRRRQRQWFRVVVRHDGVVVGERSVPVDILPVHGELASSSRLPVTLRLNTFESYRGQGAQIELEGRGPIRAGGTDIIELGIRTPDLSSSSLFARRDEYHASYISERWALLLGDHRFDLSPLTEFGRRSRGVGAVGYLGSLSVTGFYSRSRYALPRESLFGFNMSYEPYRTVRLGANFIDKSGLLGGESVTVRSEYAPSDAVMIDVEFGNALGAGQPGLAYAAGVTGTHDRGQGSARFMRTGSDFPGLYQDLKSSTIAGSARLHGGLSVAGSLVIDQRGVQQGLGIASDVSNHFARLGPTYQRDVLGGKAAISGVFESRLQSATFAAAREDRDVRTMEVRVQYGISRYSFSASVEAGSAAASFSDGRHPLSRYEFTSSANVGSTSLHAALEIDRGASMYRLASQTSTMLALGAEGRVAGRLTWSADGLLMMDSGALARRYQSLSLQAKYALPHGHIAGIRSNLSAFGSAGILHDVALSYEVPLSVGTLRAGGAQVRGIVVDAETGRPIEGAVVRVGKRSAQTGHDGVFRVPVAEDGREFLFLDATSIGLDRVPLIELPREVDEAMRTGSFEIPVAQSSKIRGVVRRYAYTDGSRQAGRMTGVATESGVLIEVTDGVGRYRATSNREGAFSLPNIRPGTWTVRIVYANLPGTHLIGEPVTVQVEQGHEAEVELRIVPRRRTIRFIDRGRVEAPEESGAGDTPPDTLPDTLPDTGAKRVPDVDDPAVASPACAAGRALPLSHKVSASETLTSLASAYYCDPLLWPFLWFANEQGVADPHWLYPGQELRVVPIGDVLPLEARPDVREVHEHVVQRGETLRAIAAEHYGDEKWWPRIWMANQLLLRDAPTVSAGMVIELPGTTLLPLERRAQR